MFFFLFLVFLTSIAALSFFLNLQKAGNREKLFLYLRLAIGPLVKTQWKTLVKEEKPTLSVVSVEKDFAIDSKHLTDYVVLSGSPVTESCGQVPHLYLEAMALPSVGFDIFTNDNFPFPALGGVHVRNEATQYRPILAKEKLVIGIKNDSVVRNVSRGSEFDFKLFAHDEDKKLVWEATASFLVMHKMNRNRKDLSAPFEDPSKDFDFSAPVKADDFLWASGRGLEYAALCGDYNPIHLYPLTAKPFGFKSHIMHGLYTAATSIGACLDVLTKKDTLKYPIKSFVAFKRPVFLPAKNVLKVATYKNDGGVCFQLESKDGKVMLDGFVSSA